MFKFRCGVDFVCLCTAGEVASGLLMHRIRAMAVSHTCHTKNPIELGVFAHGRLGEEARGDWGSVYLCLCVYLSAADTPMQTDK